ncbi:MAG: CBS domain-containing protein [Pseudonocardia sp.]|jgi:Mg/Co/Ni transporter MgtE
MSPRAACRLAALGFTHVHDYVAGKVDWLARNLPVEGTGADTPTIGRHMRHDVVTAAIGDTVTDLHDRITRSRYDFALVTNAEGVLLGRLRGTALADTDPARPVEEVMQPGPSTLRPHEPAADVHARLEARNLLHAIVTDPDGGLLGVIERNDLDRADPQR